ncbi:hypothetical protein GGS24DRAFT_513315 [Hypoxylon argillaceum]|nr:hypothetical protein GGS24DRAFT_513315 [Hypoxylon argillaceum]
MESPFNALGVMSGAISLIALARRLASEVLLPLHGVQQIDQQDVSSMRTDIDVIRNNLIALQASFEGNDIERIILQCIESGENASAFLGRLGMANHSERVQFAEHNFEVRQLLRGASMAGWNPSSLPHSPICYTRCFLLPGGLRQHYGSAFLHLLTFNIPASDREECERNMKNHILTELYHGQGQLSSRVQIKDLAMEKDIQKSFLSRLRDPEISCQKGKGCGPYKRFFNWLFDPSIDRNGNGTSFRDWASSSSSSRPTFWLIGRPGAGKTILAKEICERLSHQTDVVSYFFVGDRKRVQKGVRGFLQSILRQLLFKNPELIPIIAPSRWDILVLFGEDPKPFDTAELQQMLVSTLHQRHEASSIFIVIDALDEYEGVKSNFEILELLSKITACPGVKLCISTRPLPHLQSLIDGAPSLVLENCNSRDMEEFVTSKIEAQLSITRDSIIGLGVKEQLIHELTTRAGGCFLWAVLVTESLQKLLAHSHDDDELLRFVNNVPTGLTELFRCFLGELDASQSLVASTLRFIATFDEPVSPLRLSFMEMPFPDFAVRQNISPLSHDDLHIQSRESIEKILRASGGLLKSAAPLNNDSPEACECGGSVILIHRTLKEFIRTEIVGGSQPVLVGLADFAARYSAASLSILKLSPIGEFTVRSVLTEAIRCSYTAMFAQSEDEVHMSRVLDELEWTCYALLDTPHLMQSPWMNIEPSEFAYNCMPIQQTLKEHELWYAKISSVLQSEEMSATLRMRAMELCAKYSFGAWADGQRTIRHWPHFHCQRSWHKWPHCQREIKSGSSMLYGSDIERGQNYTIPLQEIGHSSTSNIQRFVQSNLKGYMESNGAIEQDDLDTNDDSDNKSWESWPSTGLSLDDTHPLMALKHEATDALFRGFMEYRKGHVSGTNKQP